MSIFHNLAKYGKRIAIIEDNYNKISYSKLIKESDFISSHIKNRSLILILATNQSECLFGYVGFLRNNHVVMFIDNYISDTNLDKLIDSYHPDFIFIEKSKKYLSKKKLNVILELNKYVLVKNDHLFKKKIHKDLSILLATSGSTGNPKFVRISKKNILLNTISISNFLKINENHKAITTLPMNYTYGLSIINTHIYSGAKIILTDEKIVSKIFWDLLRNTKVTSFGGVPFIYEVLYKLKVEKLNLKYIKYFTQAGGKLSNDLIIKFAEYCKKHKKKFYIMYGQTEATARMSFLPFKYILRKIGSIGKPIKNCKFEIVDKRNNIIDANNKIGNLLFYGNNVSMGYANNYKDLSKSDCNNGILKTGDLASKDKDGFYYIKGRDNRYAKLYGKRINLDDVENELRNKGFINACLEKDEILNVHIVNNKSSFDDKLKEKIMTIIIHFLKINKNIIKIKFINKLPINNYGKTMYKKLD
tara:strand:- start:247 stop:1668 length:1422 start_codon:yes stop_codon:yes gene_type:complete